MKKTDLIQKLKTLTTITDDEKAYLINLVNTKKKYGLVWEDKPEDVEELLRENLPVLKEVTDKRILAAELPKKKNEKLFNASTNNSETTNHILIEGDNLHSITALTFSHEGKIDTIYIDPPYNTGNKSWRYNNDYIEKDDPWRHSKWVSFMYKRLRIAKRLLKSDGALILAIDHNEQENIGLILSELFPEKEITCVTIVHNPRGIQGNNFSYTHEYAYFVYPMGSFIGKIKRRDEDAEWSNLRNWGGESERKDGKSLFYPLYFQNERLIKVGETPKDSFHPSTPFKIIDGDVVEIWPIDNNGIERKWRYSKDSILEIKSSVRLTQMKGYYQVQLKKAEDRPKTVWVDPKYDASVYGTQLVNEIIDSKFPFPKSLYTVFDSIQLTTQNKKDAIILDFFAGSGTTLHATMLLNQEDGGSRKCILATNNENNICEEVTYERNKRVIQGYKNAKGEMVDGLTNNNLRYYRSQFVSREPSLKNKRELTKLATELLCIKEDCYTECTNEFVKKKNNWLTVFSNGQQQYLVVIYDDEKIEEGVEALQKLIAAKKPKQQIKVYVFSNGQYPYTEEFEDVLPHITLCALPEAIYKAYMNVLPKRKRMQVPELEETSAEIIAANGNEKDLFNQSAEEK